jgi:hypothetical protein
MSECLAEICLMRAEKTRDAALIKSVITHPRVYPHVTDDGCPKVGNFDALGAASSPQFHFVCIFDGPEFLGLFMFHQINLVMYEVHTCLLPNAWGERATKAAHLARDWMYQNTPCMKIITHVPRDNVLAFRFAKRCGMKVEGILVKSIQKNGALLDQTILGMEK